METLKTFEKTLDSNEKPVETEMGIDLSTTLYRDQLLEWQKESVKGCKRKLITNESQQSSSSTTQKKKKDISMSFTDAFTTVPTADALSSEGSLSNEDELDLLLSSAVPIQQTSGLTGSSTSYKTQGRLFTWKSPEWITAQKFVDLKIYNNPNVLPEKKPTDYWKEATFRAKVLVGTSHSSVERTQKINRLLETLIPLLIAETKSQPDCAAHVRD